MDFLPQFGRTILPLQSKPSPEPSARPGKNAPSTLEMMAMSSAPKFYGSYEAHERDIRFMEAQYQVSMTTLQKEIELLKAENRGIAYVL